jgi:hypothetical protein
MRRAGRASWMISTGESSELLLALYVRRSAGLAPHTDPAIPPLSADPPPVEPVAAADRPVLEQEWAQWWQATLGELGAERRVDSPALTDYPRLHALVRERTPPPGWPAARQREEMELMIGSGRPPLLETNLVAELEAERGRRAPPFRLYVTPLPVETAQGWLVGPGSLLVTRSLIADTDAYTRLLRPVLAALIG